MSVGLDSIAASEFTTVVSNELQLSLSAIALFDHPTLESIADYVMSETRTGVQGEDARPEQADHTGAGEGPAGHASRQQAMSASIAAICSQIGGSTRSECALRRVVSRAQVTASKVPLGRWTPTITRASTAAAYGSFVNGEDLHLDGGAYGISVLEARSMDP